ncbi:MAG: hypothetical protein Q9222_001753 [Ikaeria aurantiellina]
MVQSTFFDQYPDFRQFLRRPIIVEYRRLAQKRGWGKDSQAFRIHRRECLQAEFELHFGSIERNGKLAGWQMLCQELGLTGNLSTVTQCKKKLKQIHVNILDMIDARREGRLVGRFPSQRALADYTTYYKRPLSVPAVPVTEASICLTTPLLVFCTHNPRELPHTTTFSSITGAMNIKVRTLTGKEIELDIEPDNKVSRIKERVEEKEGIPPVQQRLIFGGKQMFVLPYLPFAFLVSYVGGLMRGKR